MATNLQIPPHEVQRRLALDNPWWKAGQGIDAEEAQWPRRAYFAQFSRLVRETDVRRAVVLIGPRRVGIIVGERRLDVEVDGERYHRSWTGELCLRDQLRNMRLIELGWEVRRFWVYEARDDLDGCVAAVLRWAQAAEAAA